MAPLPLDLLIGIVSLAVAAVAILLFLRASGGLSRKGQTGNEKASDEEARPRPPPVQRALALEGGIFQKQQTVRHIRQPDVDRAHSTLRTLTLQRELLTMVIKRLFEAEDEGDITREERVRLSKGYEVELKNLSEDLKRAELIITLNELESIREDILKKYEATLTETQSRIDGILKELKLEAPKKASARVTIKMKKPEEEAADEEDEEEEVEEGTPRRRRPRKSEVEEKVDQLRREVLKELEELEKLEIEA